MAKQIQRKVRPCPDPCVFGMVPGITCYFKLFDIFFPLQKKTEVVKWMLNGKSMNITQFLIGDTYRYNHGCFSSQSWLVFEGVFHSRSPYQIPRSRIKDRCSWCVVVVFLWSITQRLEQQERYSWTFKQVDETSIFDHVCWCFLFLKCLTSWCQEKDGRRRNETSWHLRSCDAVLFVSEASDNSNTNNDNNNNDSKKKRHTVSIRTTVKTSTQGSY